MRQTQAGEGRKARQGGGTNVRSASVKEALRKTHNTTVKAGNSGLNSGIASAGIASCNFGITAVSGKVSEIQTMKDLGAVFAALDPTEDNQIVSLDRVIIQIGCYSSNTNFIVYPFVVICEDGETIATAEDTSTDPLAILDTNLSGNYVDVWFDPIVSKHIFSNATDFWVAPEVSFDITSISRKWYMNRYRRLIQEEANPHIRYGAVVVTHCDGVAVTVDGQIFTNYSIKTRKFI